MIIMKQSQDQTDLATCQGFKSVMSVLMDEDDEIDPWILNRSSYEMKMMGFDLPFTVFYSKSIKKYTASSCFVGPTRSSFSNTNYVYTKLTQTQIY